mmetsp:Transcript_40595/g.135283  ORF Transcript_40595/g.135283 Transcript_40595/m.135283 type:complete len:201 (+) Transcript_40595:381-983(+)
MAPSNEPEASHCPSGEKVTALTSCTCPVSRAIGFLPAAGAHRKTVKSSEPDASSSALPRASAYRCAAPAFAAASSAGATPRWSKGPRRSAKSVEAERELTQWPCPSSERTSLLSSGAQTLTVRSCEPEYKSPSPPQRKQVTELACPQSVPAHRPPTRSHSRTVPSLEAEASLQPVAPAEWYGSHARALTHFLCASMTLIG